MPGTIGCVSCGKCCEVQHPHCYTIEFYYILEALQSWTQQETVDLHMACVANYLNNDLEKPCVFLDENKRCRIHSHRNYNCRAFGIIPKKAYNKHVKQVKKKFPGVKLSLQKQSDCCGGVHPEVFIGARKLNEIFSKICDLDRDLGMEEKNIREGNNYMTFHDHYLLFYYHNKQDLLAQLTNIKNSCSKKEKESFLKSMREVFEKRMKEK
jgi:Fe-S-cluster containining protein